MLQCVLSQYACNETVSIRLSRTSVGGFSGASRPRAIPEVCSAANQNSARSRVQVDLYMYAQGQGRGGQPQARGATATRQPCAFRFTVKETRRVRESTEL